MTGTRLALICAAISTAAALFSWAFLVLAAVWLALAGITYKAGV